MGAEDKMDAPKALFWTIAITASLNDLLCSFCDLGIKNQPGVFLLFQDLEVLTEFFDQMSTRNYGSSLG